ncbi:hypothetical protein Dsin_015656 [Dipteronia sinensis]|uniref:Uncharacterized protein n=1 Tax=Dipteronia sinensis TaxID=43782 RepID=A0AAE0E587_9ROSI|nr:hypothetical protein Dsin_015656 [Dipteronia sinensis]
MGLGLFEFSAGVHRVFGPHKKISEDGEKISVTGNRSQNGVGVEASSESSQNAVGEWKKRIRKCEDNIAQSDGGLLLGKRKRVFDGVCEVGGMKKLKDGQDYSPDIVFFMEPKAEHNRLEVLQVKLSFVGKLVVDCVGRSGGLCLFWSDKSNISLMPYFCFHIDMCVYSFGSDKWRMTCFYSHPETDQHCHAWPLMHRLHGLAQLPWLSIEDFNEILSNDDKAEGTVRNRKLMEDFQDALDLCGLEDLSFLDPNFTWCNKREGPIQFRKDLTEGFAVWIGSNCYCLHASDISNSSIMTIGIYC